MTDFESTCGKIGYLGVMKLGMSTIADLPL